MTIQFRCCSWNWHKLWGYSRSKPHPPAWFAPDTTTDTLRDNDNTRAKIWCTTAFTARSNTPDQTCWKPNHPISSCQEVFQLLFGLNSVHKNLDTAYLSIWKTMPLLTFHMTLQYRETVPCSVNLQQNVWHMKKEQHTGQQRQLFTIQ
jgi:hypothetical protein